MSVTLKELRISKGLNQARCAEYLGMSTRNYQNYENDAAKANTARYHAIYQKLEMDGQPDVTAAIPSQIPEFYTNVVTGAGLQALAKSVAKVSAPNCPMRKPQVVKTVATSMARFTTPIRRSYFCAP